MLSGYNCRADIRLNGKLMATSDDVVRMFEQFTFDVTDAAVPGEGNVLPVTIHPLDGDVFLSNAMSVVKRVRSHPSLLLYTGGNEGYPREDLYKGLRNDIVAEMDGTGPFLRIEGINIIPKTQRL